MTVVPTESLQPETLRALVEEFITREGAVHGHADIPLDQSIRQVLGQIKADRAVVVFDEESETYTIMERKHLEASSNEAMRAGPSDADL